MINLVINPELRDYLPPLTDTEREALHKILSHEGIRDTIKYWWNPDTKRHEILDGHNRHAWASSHKKPFASKLEEIRFAGPSITAAKRWMLINQNGRRGGGIVGQTIELVKLEAAEQGKPEPTTSEIVKEVTQRTGTTRQAVESKIKRTAKRSQGTPKVPKVRPPSEFTALLKLFKQKMSDPDNIERFKAFLESL